MKPRILVISSANIDFVQNVTRLPKVGETVVETRTYGYIPGGKGANSAITFSRLGGDTVFCAKVGRDDNGARLKRLYGDEGIDTRYIYENKYAPTGLASVIVEENGDNRIIVYPGANNTMTADDVEEAFNCMPDGVFIHFEIPDEAIYAAADFAAAKCIPLFIDAGPVRPSLNIEKIGKAEIISPNEAECEALTGIYPDSVEECLRAAISLSNMADFKYVVLKIGRRGAFIYDRKNYFLFNPPKVKAIDTTAAGDIFTAAMSYAYMQKGDIGEAVRFANLAASLSVTREGASSSIPTLRDVKAFAKQVKEVGR